MNELTTDDVKNMPYKYRVKRLRQTLNGFELKLTLRRWTNDIEEVLVLVTDYRSGSIEISFRSENNWSYSEMESKMKELFDGLGLEIIRIVSIRGCLIFGTMKNDYRISYKDKVNDRNDI